jgi:hypothetical protein
LRAAVRLSCLSAGERRQAPDASSVSGGRRSRAAAIRATPGLHRFIFRSYFSVIHSASSRSLVLALGQGSWTMKGLNCNECDIWLKHMQGLPLCYVPTKRLSVD